MVTKSRNCKKKNKKTCKRKPVRKKSRRTRKKSRRRTRKKNKKKNQKKGKKKNRKKRKRKYKFGPRENPYMYDNITEALQNPVIATNLDTVMMGLQVAIQQRQAQAQAQLKDIIKSLKDHIEDIKHIIDDSEEKDGRIEALETSAKVLEEKMLPTIQQELTEDNYKSELENISAIGKGTLDRIGQILEYGRISDDMIYSRRQREEFSSSRRGDREK